MPNLLGFHPNRSLVVLGVGGPRQRISLTFRYDLPDPPDGELAADIGSHAAEVLARQAITAAIVIGYGPDAMVAGPAAATVASLADAGIVLAAVLRAEAGRFYCLACPDGACCPPGGTPFDPCSHPASAALTQAGLAALPDREALARTLEPPPGTARATRQATRRALRRLSQLAAAAQTGGRDPVAAVTAAGCGAVQDAITRYRGGASLASRARLASLAVALASLRVRDDAWARMDPGHARRHAALWTDVVTAAAPEYVPGPASLLAFTAWQAGDGALANLAAERALAADPEYTMAGLISDAVQAGLPPSAARLPMSPGEVADSYDAQ